jgi:uncharacterized membrane protein YgdD (TMEM256/DUF423 family)
MILVSGAFLGFIAVAFGAFAKHGLRESIVDEQFRLLMTALQYNQLHSVVITATGLVLLNGGQLAKILAFRWSGLLFIVGTMLFSFSIYISVAIKLPSFLNVTPIGGVTIMAAWILFMVAGVMAKRKLQRI